ncbi:hypothetical protein V8Z80_13485 [Orrella sp. JC864]|uniref:hypothetical protein n=1 Tax=Orrella sp. JC864 TaxID=3120298 RepID=UPI003009DD69
MKDTVTIPQYDTVGEAIQAGSGQADHFYFHDNPDRSRIIIFFNGAVSNLEIRGSTVFHRWTWHQYLKHPILCVADPIVSAPGTGASLAWFVGRRDTDGFAGLVEHIRTIANMINPDAEIVTMGSSGGGFAALMAVACGFADQAIVINPQTDVELFERKTAIARFKDEFSGDTNHRFSNLEKRRISVLAHGFERAKPGASIHYAQNLADPVHYSAHLLPFLSYVGMHRPDIRISVQIYTDHTKGHNPPAFKGTLQLFGQPIRRLMRSTA